jgi:hypothetical protein
MRPTILTMLFTTAFLMIGSIRLIAQQKKYPEKIKVYKAVVGVTTQEENMVGVLTNVGDSAIYLITLNEKVKIPSNVIRQIVIRRKGNVGRATLTGFLIGLGLGGIIGMAAFDSPCDGNPCITLSPGESALAGGILLGSVGTLTGFVVGTIRKERVVIGEDQLVFEKNVELLRKYALSEVK